MPPIIRRNVTSLKPQSSGEGIGIYKPGVEVCRLKGDSPIAFRILPAFPPHARVPGKGLDASGNPVIDMVDEHGDILPPDAWVPFVDEDGRFYEWLVEIRVAGYVGHGNWKQRRDIVSVDSRPDYDDEGNRKRVDDPYWELQQYVRNRAFATWGYLQKRVGDFKTGESPVLPFMQRRYLMNIVRTDQVGKVMLGELSASSAIDALNDLVLAPNKHATEESVKQDYVNAYDNGDVTDPVSGNVFVIEKNVDSGKGQASPYTIKLHSTFDRAKRITTYTVMDVEKRLPDRYDLTDIEGLVKIPTAEEQVKQLCDLLTGRTPDGMFHEYSLMKEAWANAGHDEWAALVPDPPMAPARGTVRGYEAPPEDAEEPAEDPAEQSAPPQAPAEEPQRRSARWTPSSASSSQPRVSTPSYVPPASVPQDDAGAEEPQDASVEAVDGSKPVAGVAGEASRPAGGWRERYKSKFAASQPQP